MVRTIAIGLVLALLVAMPASALVINVEPDDFLAGTVIDNSFPGVTLSVEGSSADVQALTSSITSTGTLVFGSVDLHPVDDRFWDEGTGFLRADFDSLATSVSIDMIFDDDDFGVLKAFNSSGTLLEVVELFGDSRMGPDFATATILRAEGDIAYIFAGSPTFTLAGIATGDSLLLDNLRVNVVPVPAALPLFVSGLLALGLVSRRRRRQA